MKNEGNEKVLGKKFDAKTNGTTIAGEMSIFYSLRNIEEIEDEATEQERSLGNCKVEPENLHGHGSSQLDGHLHRACAQLRAQPSSGNHRPSGRSCRGAGGAVAVYAV